MAEVTVELWNESNSAKVGDVSTDGTTVHGVLTAKCAARRMAIAPASFTVRRDHPQAAGFTRGRHVRWYVDGQHATTSRILTTDNRRVSPQGPSGETITVTCESHIGLLKDAKVRPYGGESFRPTSQARGFGPHAPETDTSSWPNAVLQYEGIASPIAGVPGFEPWEPPDGWPEPIDDVDWISFEAAPSDTPGIYVLRGTFTNPTQQDLWFCLSSDDGARLFVDGYEVIPWTVRFPGEGSFRSTWRRVVRDVSAGTHVWSVELEVLSGTPSGPRRGMVAAAVHALPPAGTILDGDTFISGTSTAWKCRTTAGDFPACNPHEAFSALLTDAQAINMANGVTLASTDSLDANGDAWTTEVPASLQVWNQSLFAVLDSWRAAGICEYEMDKSSLEVQLYNPSGLGSASGAEFTDNVDIHEDATTTDGDIVNTLGVLTEDGWELAQDATSVAAHGAVGDSLNLADAVSPTARDVAVDAFFDLEADLKASRSVILKPADATDMPGAFDAGDTVTVAGDEVRVEMWAISQTGNQLATFELELMTQLQVDEERDQLRLDRVAGGTAGGRSSVATVWQDSTDLPSGKLERRDFETYAPDNDPDTLAPVEGTSKSVRANKGAVRVCTLEVKGLWTPDEDIELTRTSYVVTMTRNGSTIATCTLAPDDFEKIVLVEGGLFSEVDDYSISATGGVGFNSPTIRNTTVEAI